MGHVWQLLKKTSPRLRNGHFQRSRQIWFLTSYAQNVCAHAPKLIPSTHPLTEPGFGSLQTSKRPLLGWDMVIFRGAEKFGTWPWMTSCARMRARTHTHTHPKHMPTPWACVWAFTDLKKSYPGLRTKILKLPQFLALFRHFSMEYNIAQLVWKALGLRSRAFNKSVELLSSCWLNSFDEIMFVRLNLSLH